MTTPIPRTAVRARWSSQRGAQLLEFALVLPVVAVLALGTLDFGNVYNTQGGVRHASREGARLAAVNNVAFTGTCQRWNAPGTFTPTTDTERLYCLTKQKAATNQVDTKVGIAITGTEVGDTVTICVQTPAHSISGMFPMLNGKTLSSKVDMRIEQTPTYAAWNPDGATC